MDTYSGHRDPFRLKKTVQHLSAIAVCAGPGSYTGLRVGMATAKGFCYALKLPLITESTLRLTAHRVIKELAADFDYALPVLICPMIDARRMEVFTALYDPDLHERLPPASLVLEESGFSDWLESNKIVFCGNGSIKWQSICRHPNAVFVTTIHRVDDLAEQAAKKYNKQEFTELAYSEPAYLKSVYTGRQR